MFEVGGVDARSGETENASKAEASVGVSRDAGMVTRSLLATQGPARQAGPTGRTRNLLSLKRVRMDTESCSDIPLDPQVWFPRHDHVGS